MIALLLATTTLAGCLQDTEEFDSSDLDQQISDLQQSQDELNQTNAELQQALTNQNQSMEEKNLIIAAHIASIEQLNQQLALFETNVSILQTQISDAESYRDSLLVLLEDANSTTEELNLQLLEANASIVSLGNSLNENQTLVAQLQQSQSQQVDNDLDGILNDDDHCPNTLIGSHVGSDGCAIYTEFTQYENYSILGAQGNDMYFFGYKSGTGWKLVRHIPHMGIVEIAAIGDGDSTKAPALGVQMKKGNGFFFRAYDAAHGWELWKTDGSTSGTLMVKDINVGSDSSIYWSDMATLGDCGDLVFAANDGIHGLELWKSDGTEQGTVMIKDINPSNSNSNVPGHINGGPHVKSMGGMVYFGADDGTHGRELWKTDGTELGTVMVKDANARDCSSNCHGSPMYITVVGDIMYLQLTGTTTSEGSQLWKSDGTEQGTVMVKDLGGPWPGSMPNRLTVAPNGSVYFLADAGGFSGSDLYITDGTEQGTNLVYGGSHGAIRGLVMVGNILMFTMDGGLWKTDGTTSGTQLVKEINLGSSGGILESDHSVDIGGELLFFGHQGRNWNQDTWQFWKSDGTDSGTFQIAIGDEKDHHQCVTGLTGKEWFKSPHAAYTTYFTPGQTEGVLFIYYV